MAYTVDVSFSPANELMTSLYTYLCKKSHKRIDLGSNWIKSTQSSLTPNFLEGIDSDELWVPLHILASQGEIQSADLFIEWLDSLSVGEIFERLSPLVHNFPTDLARTKEQMVQLLSGWNEQYFKKFDTTILSELAAEAQNQRNLISSHKDPVLFGEQLTNGIRFRPIEGLNKVLFIPQYHSQPVNYLFHFGGITVCLYSPNIYHMEEDDPSVQLNSMTKALSDKSRLKILRFLATEPSNFMGIVRHIGLAKSTVHDHLIILRSAGLINVEVDGEMSDSYRFRKEFIGVLFNQFEKYFFNKA
jgi:DNA-binding transcriptional ArsR family regulator